MPGLGTGGYPPCPCRPVPGGGQGVKEFKKGMDEVKAPLDETASAPQDGAPEEETPEGDGPKAKGDAEGGGRKEA